MLWNGLKRSVPRKRRPGPPRRGPWRSELYRRWVASMPCMICTRPETQAAHTAHNGMSSKGTDASCVPLCLNHHDQLDGRVPMTLFGSHVVSNMKLKEQFEAVHQVRLASFVKALNERWTEKTGREIG